jgi:phenylalanyl-tRNA synthetase beta chain
VAERAANMPVISLRYDRMLSLLRRPLSRQDMLEKLPFLGLDLEEEAEEYVRVEFNPNRPDFSSEWGVARALNGLLGFEIGAPEYRMEQSGVTVNVDQSVLGFRPFFVGAVVKGMEMDDETIRQMMAMQDDLDNGIGRRRSKVSTGLHNFDSVKPPFSYRGASPDFRFVPLGQGREMSMSDILQRLETGQKFGHIVSKYTAYPLIEDSEGRVLSFPPIINGETTRVSTETRNLFVDITATDLKAAEDVLAVLLAALTDLGGSLETIRVNHPLNPMTVPDLKPTEMTVESSYVNRLLGLSLGEREIIECLSRCRLDAEGDGKSIHVRIPRYRSDLIHPIDIVEEVAIGHNIANLTPMFPETAGVGRLDERLVVFDSAREVLVGLGLLEVMNYSLISRETALDSNGKPPHEAMRVENPKSGEHEYLRESIVTSLLSTLSRNIHEEYPQRLFEVGKTFHRGPNNEASEENNVAVAIAHTEANYTEVKSYLEAFLRQLKGVECDTTPVDSQIYIPGRAAQIRVGKTEVGSIGEITPSLLEEIGLRVPVSAFELNLDAILKV